MKTLRPNPEIEDLKSTNRRAGRNRLPVRTVNSHLLAIGGTQRRLHTPRGSRRLSKLEDGEPFDIYETIKEVDTTIDAEGRRWPKLSSLPRDRLRDLENTIEEQKSELSTRCIQIADLCNVQQQQAAELELTQEDVKRLYNSVTPLQAALAQQENETIAAKEALALSEDDKAALRTQLEKLKCDSDQSLQQLLDIQTRINGRENTITLTQERVDALQKELTTKAAETIRLQAIIEEAKQQRRNDFTQQTARFEVQIKEFGVILADRDKQIAKLEEMRVKLNERCDELVDTTDMLKINNTQAREKLESLIGLIQYLGNRLKVERDAACGKIAALSAELQNERLEHSNTERISAELRENIVLLLPKLTTIRNTPNISDVDILISREASVEPDAASGKIAALSAELQNERLEHSNAERISAELRENIALLLPKLTTIRNTPNISDVDTSMTREASVDLLPLISIDCR